MDLTPFAGGAKIKERRKSCHFSSTAYSDSISRVGRSGGRVDSQLWSPLDELDIVVTHLQTVTRELGLVRPASTTLSLVLDNQTIASISRSQVKISAAKSHSEEPEQQLAPRFVSNRTSYKYNITFSPTSSEARNALLGLPCDPPTKRSVEDLGRGPTPHLRRRQLKHRTSLSLPSSTKGRLRSGARIVLLDNRVHASQRHNDLRRGGFSRSRSGRAGRFRVWLRALPSTSGLTQGWERVLDGLCLVDPVRVRPGVRGGVRAYCPFG